MQPILPTEKAVCAHCNLPFIKCKCEPNKPLLTKWISNPWHYAATDKPPANKYVVIRMRNGSTYVGKFGYQGNLHKQQWSSGGFRLYTEDIAWWMNPEDLPATPEIPTCKS